MPAKVSCSPLRRKIAACGFAAFSRARSSAIAVLCAVQLLLLLLLLPPPPPPATALLLLLLLLLPQHEPRRVSRRIRQLILNLV